MGRRRADDQERGPVLMATGGEKMGSVLRVAIVDDHAVFAEGLRVLLESAGGSIDVVVVETRPGYAVEAVRQHVPDVAIVDVAMPSPGGTGVISAIKARQPEVRILALSGVDEFTDAEAALRAGADGFLPKTARLDELLRPLEAVAAGWSVMPKALLVHLLERSRRRPSAALLDNMGQDERRLWKLIALGRDTEQIAGELFVSERTAKRQVASLLRRIGVETRTEAAARAGQMGLLEED